MTGASMHQASFKARPSRVPMHYEVDVNGVSRRIELPFVMGVIADFSGEPLVPAAPVAERAFVPVDADGFDEFVAAIEPRVAFTVPNCLSGVGELNVEFVFNSLEDFAPLRVAAQIDAVRRLLDGRDRSGGAVDQLANAQLNAVLHHPSFQRLEATWRGLHRLVTHTETDDDLKIVVLNLSKSELAKSLRRYKGTAWDQSFLFKRIYEERLGTDGGEPFGCVLLDYEFDHGSRDLETLGEIAKIGAAAHVPFLAAAAPGLINLESWEELPKPRDLSKVFTTPEHAAWRALRESDEARQLALILPRFVARPLYGPRNEITGGYQFREDADAGRSGVVWANAGYLLAEKILRSFRIYGWCSHICGLQTGGAVEGLPAAALPRLDGPCRDLVVTEVGISSRREGELARNGLIALVARPDSDMAEFVSAMSLHKPAEYDDADATADALSRSRLVSVLTLNRVAHYLRALTRDVLPSLSDRATAQAWLQRWIDDYVEPAMTSLPARSCRPRPLRVAEVQVEEAEGSDGGYVARFHVRPNF
jgi:type VI secretion system protein ImpC